ncbi:Rgg/GadR/MutR family transcriptional regulator [Listeria monocytogenes]|nr:Rgg/GadR/MutR family transcriptional regulator [Listeria monocytogenes]EAC9571672.1 Rgg/GadR/MutR family transcriptional regulator [Listeria monocytogenes]EAC9724939.1 Rgg/GadR/MutR family transcriptional regulator [Listeria monocytogenes]EAD7178158.1 Rgg/GadR/MutR family transcriptional regulator [Listeria monocytogenes]EAE6605781.1 Rgg/GadR/MutR family transcriptional regulator [Listeria monocytogenes]
MESYGELIRELRLSKGLTQKEVYTGIISRSYAIKFEKGENEITLSLFEEILGRVMVSLDEFFFIYRGYSSGEEDDFWHKFASYANENDVNSLQQLYHEIGLQNGKRTDLRKAVIRARIRVINNFVQYNTYDVSIVSKEDKEIIHDYLWNVQSWTLEEIRIFANSVAYFEEEVQIQFFQLVVKSSERYLFYDRGRLQFCGLFTNVTEELILHNKLKQAEQVLAKLVETATKDANYNCFLFRVLSKYYQGLIWMKEDRITEGYQQAQKAIQTLEDVWYEKIAELYRVILKQFIEKENIKIAD